METTEGTVRKVRSHKPSRWDPAGLPRLYAELDSGEVVAGSMAHLASGEVRGERYRFYGQRRMDLKNEEVVFNFEHHEVLIPPSADGVADYLFRHIEGVGRAKAYALVAAFGGETLHVLRTDPERALEVREIDEKLAARIAKHFEDEVRVDPAAYARLVTMLADYEVPRKLITRLLIDWGSDAPEKVRANPYLLLSYPRMGWDKVDRFALATASYRPDGLERQKAAILESLSRATDDGHTVAQKIDIQCAAFNLARTPISPEAWAAVFDEGRVAVADEGTDPAGMGVWIAPPKLDAAERYIAARLARLRAAANPLPVDPAKITGLHPDQMAAARMLLETGFGILTGPPGVGKTKTISRILKLLVDSGITGIRFCSPTGKAAKRGEELIREAIGDLVDDVKCSTIHKALGIGPNDDDEGVPEEGSKIGRGRSHFGFKHGEDEPLDGNVFICDELSMVDVSLAAALLAAIPAGATVILVGDADQLPSVGPGSVMRDLIAAGVPTVVLSQILRSDGGGRVVRACHAIRKGQTPEPAARLELPIENWKHLEIPASRGPQAIGDQIIELVSKVQAGSKLGLDPVWDVQVISAQHRIPGFGCDDLNERLSRLLNERPGELVGKSDDLRFRVGDKVIRRKNKSVDEMVRVSLFERSDWKWKHPVTGEGQYWAFEETTVVNGDMGAVEDVVITDRGGWAVVAFRNPDRLCRLALGSCHLQRAYATTVHSSQGSGFRYVIVPVHSGFFFDDRSGRGLWCRELFYTAISRAEDLLVTVGEFSSIPLAIKRQTLHRRRTRLVQRIAATQLVVPAGPQVVDVADDDDLEPIWVADEEHDMTDVMESIEGNGQKSIQTVTVVGADRFGFKLPF